jgi:hypothetical protein
MHLAKRDHLKLDQSHPLYTIFQAHTYPECFKLIFCECTAFIVYLDVIDGGEAGLEPVDDGGGGGVHHYDELLQIDDPVVVDVAKGEDSVYFLNKTTFKKT